MSAEQNVAVQKSDKQDLQRETTQRATLLPPVDIMENEEGISLSMDMPGVDKDHLGVRVDGNTLTIEGEAHFGMPTNLESLYAEVRSARYQRGFTLSRELDSEKIEAQLKNGVLKLRIPRHEAAKPRRIEVKMS